MITFAYSFIILKQTFQKQNYCTMIDLSHKKPKFAPHVVRNYSLHVYNHCDDMREMRTFPVLKCGQIYI